MARGDGDGDGPHPVDRHVGRRVAEKRISLGYNQSELGKALGLTFQQVQKYEKGSNRVSASKLWAIANFLKVDIAYFFDGLAPGQPGVAEPGVALDHETPQTRHAIEIAALARRLGAGRQKVALELIRSLLDRPTPEK